MGAVGETLDSSTAATSLRRRGLRATSARVSLIVGLSQLGHATPEQLHAALVTELPHLSPSTVYRTLESLAESGFVRHAHLSGSAPSYYLSTAAEHAHLVCRNCGAVMSLAGEPLLRFVSELAASSGFAADISHLTIEGRCRHCPERATSDRPPPVLTS